MPTDTLPKVRLVGERLAAATVPVPVPERLTDCWRELALSATLNVADRAPLADGVKVMLMVHLVPAANEVPQLLVWTKLLALAPETPIPVKCWAVLLELVRVTGSALLDFSRSCVPKLRLAGDRLVLGGSNVAAAALVVPPPPQEMDKTVMAIKAAGRTGVVTCRRCGVTFGT